LLESDPVAGVPDAAARARLMRDAAKLSEAHDRDRAAKERRDAAAAARERKAAALAFTAGFRARMENGEATHAAIAKARTEGVLTAARADRLLAEMEDDHNRRAEAFVRTSRIASLLQTGGRPDAENQEDRADVADHYETALKPTLADLDPAQQASAIGTYVAETGIAPDAAVNALMGLTVIGEAANRIAAARQLISLFDIDRTVRDRLPNALAGQARLMIRLHDIYGIPPEEAVATPQTLFAHHGLDDPDPTPVPLAGSDTDAGAQPDGQTHGPPPDARPDAVPVDATSSDDTDDDPERDENDVEIDDDDDTSQDGRSHGGTEPAPDTISESGAHHEAPLARETAPRSIDESGEARPIGADLLADLDNEFRAAQQGTSAVVRRADGTLNYRRAPQSEQDLFDEQNIVRDPSRFVVLRDPETNNLTVFERAPETDEGGIARLGRLLGLGLASDPIRFGKRGITEAAEGAGRNVTRGARVATGDQRYVTKGNRAFVALEDGTIDFGKIDSEVASVIRREPAPIRLPRGDARFGEQHISRPDRAAQIEKAGFESPAEFVLHVAQNFDEIWEARG
jgi:hypothetical protein